MAWNGSDNHGRARTPAAPQKKAPGVARGLVAGAAAVVLVSLVLFLVIGRARTPAEPKAKPEKQSAKIAEAKPANCATNAAFSEKMAAAELNEKVRPYIKKKLDENVTLLSEEELDENDPDNILRTRFAQDVGQLLSITPGEDVPPMLVFYFMIEDDDRNARVSEGEKVITTDNGNKDFLDSLKKWKVTIKGEDSEARREAKEQLMEAQLDLLKGIDEGTSVNDSIRAAYEFRIEAAKTRNMIMDEIARLHDEDGDEETTRKLIDAANEKLAAEGILPIEMDNIRDLHTEIVEQREAGEDRSAPETEESKATKEGSQS